MSGSRSGYRTTSVTSKATSPVKPGTLARGKVKVTGTAKVGAGLKATTSKWSSGVTYHYQWYRDSERIAGGTDKTYLLTSADAGKKMKVKVWTTKAGYTRSASWTSAKTAAVKH